MPLPILPKKSINKVSISKIASDKQTLSNNTNIGVDSIISVSPIDIYTNSSSTDKSFSPKLLNWVEPVIIKGIFKTLFYTDVNSNLKKGDRIFIIDGNYDSNILITDNKYKKGRDGYKILDIDRCKITLDIDYTGVLPFNDDSIDNFIKVFYVKSQREFDYINKQITSEDLVNLDPYLNPEVIYKYELGHNNFIFVDSNYSGISSGLGENTGVTASTGFYYRNNGSWINITSDILSNNITGYLSTNITNNERIKILNGTFTYNSIEWRENSSYKYEDEWAIDVTYMSPFLTKSNFRDGNFKGTWNKGIYGSYNKKIHWVGDKSIWNNGTLINCIWDKGSVNSSFIPSKSYYAEIDEFGLPNQKIQISNNNGWGYNYFIDSDVSTININNGNFIYCNIGINSSTFSTVDNYYQSWNLSYDITSNKGSFRFCNFESSFIKNSDVYNSRLNNSKIESSKSINSSFNDSLFYKSDFNSDDIIKILAYDEWNAHLGSTSSGDPFKIYKLYFSEKYYERIKSLDHIYINNIKLLNNIQDVFKLDSGGILNYFDREFILDGYSDYNDIISSTVSSPSKSSNDVITKISSISDNQYKLGAFYDGSIFYTDTTIVNNNQYPSIDIIVKVNSGEGDYNTQFISSTISNAEPTSLGSNIDISNSYIINSDFRNGLFENSNWNNGYYYNYDWDNYIINVDSTFGGVYGITIPVIGGNEIDVPVGDPVGISDNSLQIGDIVYLNSIDYNDFVNVTRLPSIWTITNILTGIYSNRTIRLKEYGTQSITSGLTANGLFLTSDGLTSSLYGHNRYNYVHKMRINNSYFKSGILRRSFISDSIIYKDDFNNDDYLFSNIDNIKKMIIIDGIFAGSENTIKSGLIMNSYITTGDDIWTNGILYRSIYNNNTFNNGVVKQSTWINGTFIDGIFYDCKTSYNDDNINIYYKSGQTVYPSYNSRWSWRNGTFKNGNFFNSIWENGIWENGNLYKSNWFDGIWKNGIIGKNIYNTTDTNFYGGTFSNGFVNNAFFYSDNQVITPPNIYWYDGVFNSGVFSNGNGSSYWYDGVFNSGEFTNSSQWINGIFNGGKFTSYFGCTMSGSTSSSDYSWRNGVFNGGEFGNAQTSTNSTWYTGELNGGVFKGRLWYNGVLTGGEFQGSSTYSAVGGYNVDAMTNSNALSFVNSFTNSYYGLWLNGFVTDVKDKFIKDKKIFTTPQRSITAKKSTITAKLKNMLWLSGTFSHSTGEMNNSVWLDGSFEAGTFQSSSFNPYVIRNGGTQSSFNLSDDCIWYNGKLDNSDFYISKWKQGKFILGTAFGMIWEKGISNYMNAYNIFWEDGTWRNGNWYGSYFQFNGDITNDFNRQILFRGMSWSGTSSCHIWNVFRSEDVNDSILIDVIAATPSASIFTPGWVGSDWGWTSSGVDGIIRASASNPTVLSPLYYSTIYAVEYKSNKSYQYITSVTSLSGNDYLRLNTLAGTFTYSATGNSGTNSLPISSGNVDICFYGSPPSNISTTLGVHAGYFATASQFPESSNRIRNLKIVELDWFVQGGSLVINNSLYKGWSYDDSVNAFYWKDTTSSSARNSILGYTGSNYFGKYVSYPSFNLSFDFLSTNVDVGLYLTPNKPLSTLNTTTFLSNLTSTGLYLGSLTQSGSYVFYGLTGSQYLSFVADYTASIQTGEFTNIEITGGYQETDNNEQFLFTDTDEFYNPTPLQILGGSTDATYSILIGNGSNLYGTTSTSDTLNSKVGNGTFRAGVWENGVWNSGWRVDQDVYDFEDISISLSMFTKNTRWRIQVTGATTSVSNFNIGDRVSIGNIVAIDINENRKLLKNYFTIINKTTTDIIVEFDNSFPLRRIERDSVNHKIKITKNVWLNGGFLNGFFEGVWNNGLFKGFPLITEMFNTHWIDGTFDGGHYFSEYPSYRFVDTYYISALALNIDSSFEGKLGLTFGATAHGFIVGDIITINKDNPLINSSYNGTTSVIKIVDSYLIITDKSFGSTSTLEGGIATRTESTGVIQNFKFYDNNVAAKTSADTQSLQEIYLYNSWIDVTYSTQSATNIGKNQVSYTQTIGEYAENNLYGFITEDILSSLSNFRNSYSNGKQNYSLGTKYKIYNDFIGDASEFNEPFGGVALGGMDNFDNNGWIYGTYGIISAPSFTREPDEYLQVTSTSVLGGVNLDNTNINITKRRYSIIEFDLIDYGFDGETLPIFGVPNIYLNNSIYFPGGYNTILFPSAEFVDHRYTITTRKHEYFYNRRGLDIAMLNYIGGMTFSVDNIKLYEIDMVPFFRYSTEDYINKSVQIPYQGIAPFIDYNDSDFVFVDNINIGFDSLSTQQSIIPLDGSSTSAESAGGIFTE